jgi:hypothetical protein
MARLTRAQEGESRYAEWRMIRLSFRLPRRAHDLFMRAIGIEQKRLGPGTTQEDVLIAWATRAITEAGGG